MRRLFLVLVVTICGCTAAEEPPESREAFTEAADGRLVLTDIGRAEGWISLFNGRDLEGWEPSGGTTSEDYVVIDGELRFPREGKDGYIRTAADFEDFELVLDFKIAFMCNSGLFLRGDRAGGNPAFSGCEVQILDDFNWEKVTSSTLKPYQLTGGLYGSVPAAERVLRPLGEWNRYRVRYVGSRIRVELNDTLLYHVDTHEVAGDPPFTERAPRGFIGLQRHAPAQVRDEHYACFRNVWVRPVTP